MAARSGWSPWRWVLGVAIGLAGPAEAAILDAAGAPEPSFDALWAWYDAGVGVNPPGGASDGAPVARWEDRSAKGHDLVGSDPDPERRPDFRANASGEAESLDFDGDDHLEAEPDFGAIVGDHSVFFVTRLRAADGGFVFSGQDGGVGTSTGALMTISGIIAWRVGAGNGPPPELDRFQVHAVVSGADGIRHYIDGALVTTSPPAGAPLSGLVLGSDAAHGLRLNGEIAELLVYTSALADSEREAVEGYLRARHASETPDEPPPFVDVFSRGDGLYASYRIPALLTTRAGTLLAFAEGRDSIFVDQAANDIVLRRSTDLGSSWGPVTVLADAGEAALNDPLAVEVREGPHAGRVLLLYQRFPAGCPPGCVEAGGGPERSARNFLLWSDDDGLGWSGPFDVTEQVKRASAAFAGAPGIGIQKRRPPHAGRIVMPFREVAPTRIYAVTSDDGGESWALGQTVDDSATPGNGDEVQVVELVDGSLLLNARSAGGTKHRKIASSHDGGESWTPLAEELQLIEPQVMASLLRFTDPLDGFARSRLLYAGPHSTNTRVAGRVHLSLDEGATWSEGTLVWPGKYGYSVLTALPDRRVGVLFERARREGFSVDVEHLSFARLTLEELSSGEDCFADEPECPLGAYGVPIRGQRLDLFDPASRPDWRRLAFASHDRAIVAPEAGSAADPSRGGAVLAVRNPATGEAVELTLPAARWSRQGRGERARWRYRDSSRSEGPCARAELRDGRLTARCVGDGIGFSLDEAGGQGALEVSLAAGDAEPWCMHFGGRVIRDAPARRWRPGAFRARQAPAPERCGP